MNSRKVLSIILPNVQAAMTGVCSIQRAHGLVTLEYTDGTREAANITAERWAAISENPFAIVGEVQGQRARRASDAIPVYTGKGEST